ARPPSSPSPPAPASSHSTAAVSSSTRIVSVVVITLLLAVPFINVNPGRPISRDFPHEFTVLTIVLPVGLQHVVVTICGQVLDIHSRLWHDTSLSDSHWRGISKHLPVAVHKSGSHIHHTCIRPFDALCCGNFVDVLEPIIFVVIQLERLMTVYRQRFFMCPIPHTPGVCDSFSEPKNHLLEVRMPEHHRIQSWFAFFPDFIFHTHRRIQFGHNVSVPIPARRDHGRGESILFDQP